MYKMFIAACLAVFIWILPASSNAAFPPEAKLHRAYLEDINRPEGIAPASARFVHVSPYGTFASGSFGGPGLKKFGKRGSYPHKPYKFGKYGGQYGYYPFPDRYGSFYNDPFFYDPYSRFAPEASFGFSPYYSPFGTRRPGW